MRFAVQTIVFGPLMTRFYDMCSAIRRVGYSGLELFQDFTNNGKNTKGQGLDDAVNDILKAVIANNLTLIGVASGALTERIAFVELYSRMLTNTMPSVHPPYVYVDEWTPECVAGVNRGMRFAIHPHMYRPIQTLAEAEIHLNKYPDHACPNLSLLPDTAHLTIAGTSPLTTLKKHFKRITAIHLKDWNPNVGKSYQFYASGFCDLGEGKVHVRETLNYLWTHQYRGWIVVEHDHSGDPEITLNRSLNWIEKHLPPGYIQGQR